MFKYSKCLQNNGVATGSPSGLTLANVFMVELERELVLMFL